MAGRYPERLLGPLPLGTDLRFFYNYSENFNPVGARRNVFNELLPPPTSETKEYGAIVDLFDGKISARFNLFETAGADFSYSGLNSAVSFALNTTGFWLNRVLEAEQQGFSLEEANG